MKEQVMIEESKTVALLSKIEELLASAQTDPQEPQPHYSLWAFGTPKPTALDTHIIPFIARLLNVGRSEMLAGKDRVRAYANCAFRTEGWKDVMQGRRTVYGTYL